MIEEVGIGRFLVWDNGVLVSKVYEILVFGENWGCYVGFLLFLFV